MEGILKINKKEANAIAMLERVRSKVVKVLYAIVFFLVFEGVVRKLLPSAVGIVIFFAKDLLCLYGLVLVSGSFLSKIIEKLPLSKLRLIFFALFIPCLIVTNFYDPFIMIFGLKQYMLFMIVGILVPFAYPPERIEEFKKFLFYISAMIIPTTLVAILQNGLPATHWLNKSVDGDSLEAFSAGGLLRVSSTFPFTGQYCMFLNFVAGIAIAYICLLSDMNKFTIKQKIFSISLIIGFIIGAFITGGRSAVLGTAASLAIGMVVAAIKSPGKVLTRAVSMILLGVAMISVLKMVKPEYFLVYELRSEGEEKYAESNGGESDFQRRVTSGLFKWVDWFDEQEAVQMLFGNGIGVTSNGSEKISKYAAVARKTASVEGEMESVVWEGGIYLFLIWTGMKIYVNIACFKVFNSMKSGILSIGVAFLLGYIAVTGVFGYLSKQPPISIYFWLSVGCVMTMIRYQKAQLEYVKK